MKKWLPYLIVGALLLGGLLVSAFYSPIWYDDAGHFLVAREVARGHGMCYPLDSSGGICIPDSPFITMGPVQTYPLGGWLAVFGETMLAGRMCMVLLSLLACCAYYFVGKQLTNASKALISIGLMALNIQFLTYGAEVLGEVPMMGFVLVGIGFLLRWERRGAWWNAGLALICWCLAVGVKEYAILPTGLGLLIWTLSSSFRKQPLQPSPSRSFLSKLALLCAYALALALTLTLIHGGDLLGYFQKRQSYGSEFLAFNLGLSLKFLLLKPLFWLGTGAMILKWRVKRRPQEALTLSVQMAWLVFFLLSAGYDRFGFLLLFLPAIYVAEFVPYLWKEAGRTVKGAWLRRVAVLMVGFVLFSQQTWWVFGKRILDPGSVNEIERTAAKHISEMNSYEVVTADQQFALFLEEVNQDYRLVSIVPSQGRIQKSPHPEFSISEQQLFLAGPFAFSEDAGAIDWKALVALDSLGVGEEKWVIYGRR